ncbi:IgGFc-binding protein [Astyanax mexicanus]|uniref:IgGFc-binding protein n=1 Tax=Astyanax mexicanus TaxID=7994 RepID=UPI0020CB4810|nr:IgGFc-binding protein [Astyanax mexicanus]
MPKQTDDYLSHLLHYLNLLLSPITHSYRLAEMGPQKFLLWFGILTVAAVSGCPIGREFITAFMPNHVAGDGTAKPTLTITAQQATANVLVEIKGLNFKQSLKIEKGATKYITLPANAEISQDGVSAKTVLITSDTDITVMSAHIKPFTGDCSVIFPNTQLGRSHVAFTPDGGPMKKIVAIVNGKDVNTVDILPYSDLVLASLKHLQRGVKLTITLNPYEVYLLRSDKTLSGTRIDSKLPLAVLGGHECLSIDGTCEHVYEQLVPVESLSDEYLVPAMHLIVGTDTAHVVAAQDNTDVTVYHGPTPQHKTLNAGELLNIRVQMPTIIRSNKKIMVMYTSSNTPFDEFLTNIIPVSGMAKSWTIHPQDDYQSFAVIVSEVETKSFFGFLTLNAFPANKKYSWSIKPLLLQKGPKTMSGDSLQAVYVFGGKIRHGYSTTGICNTPPLPPPLPADPCENVKCSEKEQCQKGVCVRIESATCWAIGDPHYQTFDGKRFDFQGTCTYTMSATTKKVSGLVPFIILAKNNHRGSNRVAYVRTVSVNVYDQTVVASKQVGVVEVNGEITHLPISLAGGKLQVVQRGWSVLITTNFGLEVKYDWNMMLYITVPSTYFGALGGLCGNYNGDRADDHSDSKGTKLSTILEFAKSWKVEDNDLFCHDDCEGKCLSCPAELQEKYTEEKHCGLLAKPNGPFGNCHKVVDPHIYMDNCVYDVCINKGIRTFLCDNMRTYAEACMTAGVKIDANWRVLSDCPLQCPENSHYEPCGTACPASCGDRDAPTKCKSPCLEGCQCNPGFVLSDSKCVPVKQCGCTYEGLYYPPIDAFWGDKSCTKKCSCNPVTGQVKCATTKCRPSEVCDIRNGIRDCYPQSFGHCQGAGDPHYKTFDGRAFDFQGTCTYYLSKLVDVTDATLTSFEVMVKNENRGMNKAVSYTKTVQIKVFEYTITMSKDNHGKVMVNDLFVNLPFDGHDGQLSIFRSGLFGIVKTNFGMTVQFNWESHVSIILPSTYSNKVGGLCGNWNGNPKDDLTMPDKTLASTVIAFGTSWKVRNDPGCTEECQGKKCPKCDAAERKNSVFTKACGLITDKNGPFKGCHARVDPTQYYEDCLYDMCMYGGHSTALCNALSAYTAVCQTALTVVESWRTDNFCPASCKANSHYDICGAGCPQTCSGLAEPTACEVGPCIEGCVCDEGFVLSNGECVAMERCGCTQEGLYYHLGQIFYPKDECSQRCTCGDQGVVKCEDSSCGPNERCEIRDGVHACHPEGKGSCSVSGSGTYHSYDGNHISVPGNCVYRMVEMVQIVDLKRTPFSVSVQQLSALGEVIVTRKVNVVIDGYSIALLPGLLWEIRVDQVKAVLPLVLEEGLVKVYQSGAFIILETSFGLKVTYDTVSMVTVEIPSTYKKAVRGVCGDYNGNKENDLTLPDGTQAASAEAFVQGWISVQEEVICQTGCGSSCTIPNKNNETKAENACKILTQEKGPFTNCYSKVSPTPIYDACVKDVASNLDDKTLVCRHIQKYVAQCQDSGISISIWRNATFCPMTCPAKSHYELCADTCSSTCASLTMSQTCPVCLEGCQCDEGFVFDGGECKPVDDCGCLVNGRYYKSGESSVSGDCVEVCSCKAGQFTCKPMKCSEVEVCRKMDGIPACVFDPCKNKDCREKEQCMEKEGKGMCVPKSKASCRAVGDPHYQTFDGSLFSFQGTCSYVLAKTSGEDKTLTNFTIIHKNELALGARGSYIKSVIIKLPGHDITVIHGNRNKVTVDGKETSLPVYLDSGAISIEQSGLPGVLKTDFGLEVTFDWGEFFLVTVSSSYYKNLEGMCGNYNGEPSDDFVTPAGETTDGITEWAASWSVPDNDRNCWHFPACTDEQKKLYNGPKYCGLLVDPTGPFANCNETVRLSQFPNDCLFYACLTHGSRITHCKALTSYVNSCQLANTNVSPEWKQITRCP